MKKKLTVIPLKSYERDALIKKILEDPNLASRPYLQDTLELLNGVILNDAKLFTYAESSAYYMRHKNRRQFVCKIAHTNNLHKVIQKVNENCFFMQLDRVKIA